MRSSLSAVVAFTFFSRFAFTAVVPQPARPTTAVVSGWESLGCFKESYPGRAIEGEIWYDDLMTVEKCANFCESKNYLLMGLEYGKECHCGNKFRERNPAPIGNCWLGCGGNPNESCGNADRINAYSKIVAGIPSSTAVPTTVALTTQIPVTSTSVPTPAPSSTTTTTVSPDPLPSSSTTSSLILPPSTTTVVSPAPLPSTSIPSSDVPLPTTTSSESSTILPLPTTTSAESTTLATSSSFTTSVSSSADPSSTTAASSTIIPSATPVPASYYSQGCYSDSIADRTLTGKYGNSNAQTIEKCAASCAGFDYFGLEYWFECFCGNELSSSSSPLPEIECNTKCNGNSAQTCGGALKMSLYSFSMPSPLGPVALGCYTDSVFARSMSVAALADDSMTVALCSAHCAKAGTKLFGVEYGRECYCGNTISSVKTPDSDCKQPCAGDSSETCGAGNRLSVYKFSI